VIRKILRLFPYVRRLEDGVDQLSNDLAKALTGELTLERMVAERGECKIEIGTKMASFLAASFYSMLDKAGAENYIEISFIAPDGKPITVTIRRHDGKTPDQLYKELLTQCENKK
jgi:hypothetical protein